MHKGQVDKEHNDNHSGPAGEWAAGQVHKGGLGVWMMEAGSGRDGPSDGITPGSDRDLVAG